MSQYLEKFHFGFNIDIVNATNPFSLFLGGLLVVIFILSAVLAFIHRKDPPAVTLLTKPDKDAFLHEYLVVLRTSITRGSQLTDRAVIKVQLLGSYKNSPAFELHQEDISRKLFRPGAIDIFVLYVREDLGEVGELYLTLYNWSEKEQCTWRPCFVEVIKSSTMERWGAEIHTTMTCKTVADKVVRLVKDTREDFSMTKLILMYHPLTSHIFRPQKFGAYTNFTHVVFLFFNQSCLLLATLLVYILSSRYFDTETVLLDLQPAQIILTLMASAIANALTDALDLVLENTRPLRMGEDPWTGLYRPKNVPRYPFWFDVYFEWQKILDAPQGKPQEPPAPKPICDLFLYSEASSVSGYTSGHSTADEATLTPAATRFKAQRKVWPQASSRGSSVSALESRVAEQTRREWRRYKVWKGKPLMQLVRERKKKRCTKIVSDAELADAEMALDAASESSAGSEDTVNQQKRSGDSTEGSSLDRSSQNANASARSRGRTSHRVTDNAGKTAERRAGRYGHAAVQRENSTQHTTLSETTRGGPHQHTGATVYSTTPDDSNTNARKKRKSKKSKKKTDSEPSEESESNESLTKSGETTQTSTTTTSKSKPAKDKLLHFGIHFDVQLINECVHTMKSELMGTAPVFPSSQEDRLDREDDFGTGPFLVGRRGVLGMAVTPLTAYTIRPSCQFCLWVRELPVRGDNLSQYAASLLHYIKRNLRAMRLFGEMELLKRVLTICVHQLAASLCTRILLEVVRKLQDSSLFAEDLEYVLSLLMSTESNLWWALIGHRDTRLAAPMDILGEQDDSRPQRRASVHSNIFLAIMRYLEDAERYRRQEEVEGSRNESQNRRTGDKNRSAVRGVTERKGFMRRTSTENGDADGVRGRCEPGDVELSDVIVHVPGHTGQTQSSPCFVSEAVGTLQHPRNPSCACTRYPPTDGLSTRLVPRQPTTNGERSNSALIRSSSQLPSSSDVDNPSSTLYDSKAELVDAGQERRNMLVRTLTPVCDKVTRKDPACLEFNSRTKKFGNQKVAGHFLRDDRQHLVSSSSASRISVREERLHATSCLDQSEAHRCGPDYYSCSSIYHTRTNESGKESVSRCVLSDLTSSGSSHAARTSHDGVEKPGRAVRVPMETGRLRPVVIDMNISRVTQTQPSCSVTVCEEDTSGSSVSHYRKQHWDRLRSVSGPRDTCNSSLDNLDETHSTSRSHGQATGIRPATRQPSGWRTSIHLPDDRDPLSQGGGTGWSYHSQHASFSHLSGRGSGSQLLSLSNIPWGCQDRSHNASTGDKDWSQNASKKGKDKSKKSSEAGKGENSSNDPSTSKSTQDGEKPGKKGKGKSKKSSKKAKDRSKSSSSNDDQTTDESQSGSQDLEKSVKKGKGKSKKSSKKKKAKDRSKSSSSNGDQTTDESQSGSKDLEKSVKKGKGKSKKSSKRGKGKSKKSSKKGKGKSKKSSKKGKSRSKSSSSSRSGSSTNVSEDEEEEKRDRGKSSLLKKMLAPVRKAGSKSKGKPRMKPTAGIGHELDEDYAKSAFLSRLVDSLPAGSLEERGVTSADESVDERQKAAGERPKKRGADGGLMEVSSGSWEEMILQAALGESTERPTGRSRDAFLRKPVNASVISAMCDTFSDCANCVVYRYKCLSHHGGECCVCGNLLCQTYAAAYNQFGPHAIAIIRHFTPAVHRGLVTPFPDKDGWLRLEWELERTLRHEVLVYVMKRCNFLVKQGVSVDCDFMGGIRKELRKEHQWKGERSAFLQTRDEVNTAEMKLESVEDLPWDDEYEPKGREWFHSQLRELALRTAHELAQIKPGEAFMELGRFQQEQEVQKEVVAPSRPLPRDEKGNVLLCNFDYDPILNDKGKPIVAESATLTDLPSCSYVEYFTFQPWMVTPYEINWVLLQYPFSKPILTRLKLYWDRWRPLAGWAGSDVDTGEIDFYLGGDVIADTLIEVAEDELWKEAEWTLGLKVVMARLIVESREEVAHELHDSMHVCLIKFSRAILIALLNAMLPSEEDAEAEKVTADDIRAGRRRRGKAQRYNIPDKKKKVPWNIDLIEDVMTALSERWFIESEENSFENASYFLGRCLALANLTSWTEGIFRVGRSMPALALDSLSHVMFVKHEIEEAVSIAAAEVIVWTIPAAQDALKQVRLLLGDYYDKVSYFVETLTVLELQTLHKVSRRVNSAASRVVQEIMFELATWREEICTAEDNALDKALSEAGDSDDGSFRVKQKAKKKVPAVCNELYETRKFVYTVRQHIGLRHAVDICKYIQITNRRQNELVTLNLTSISDAPVLGEADDEDFTVLQLREVEWVLTGQTEKPLPASFTPLIEMGMIVGVVGGLVTMAVLGSTLEVEAITRWFFLHSVALFLCIFVFGPTKAVWHKDWGWTPPWEVVLEARKRRQLEDQTRERDGSAKKEESKVLPKEQDEEEEPLKELKIVDVTPAD